jgi:hypothetical protein
VSDIDWAHHTVDSLRALCREYQQRWWDEGAKVATCEFLARIEATPQAWRIYGAIDHALTNGYDADHIVRWLSGGYAAYEQDTYLREIETWRRRAESAESALSLALVEPNRLRAERDGGTAIDGH